MIKTPDKTNRGGFNFELTQNERDAGYCLFLTGPIGGTFRMEDGTTYDVTPAAIALKEEHIPEMQYELHRAHHEAGRYTNIPLPPDPLGR